MVPGQDSFRKLIHRIYLSWNEGAHGEGNWGVMVPILQSCCEN